MACSTDLASRLKHIITLYQLLPTSDGGGGIFSQWQQLMTIHAEASSKEMRTQNTIEPNIYYQFTVRYQAGISNAMRIKYRNQFFDIIKIVNVREENTELRITARLGSEGI